MKNPSKKEVKKQPRPNEECPKDIDAANVAASGATSANVSTCRYKTQGTIASIDLMCKSFTMDPISPYVFEQRKGDSMEKFMLFVLVDDKDNVIKSTKILTCKPDFKISTNKNTDKDVDLGALIALKNGREKIELEVELKDDFDAGKDKLQVESLKTIK